MVAEISQPRVGDIEMSVAEKPKTLPSKLRRTVAELVKRVGSCEKAGAVARPRTPSIGTVSGKTGLPAWSLKASSKSARFKSPVESAPGSNTSLSCWPTMADEVRYQERVEGEMEMFEVTSEFGSSCSEKLRITKTELEAVG